MRKSDEKNFTATGYVGTTSPQGTDLRMTNPKEISRWRLGQIQVSRGQSKDPIDVDVKYFNQSLPRE